MIKRGPYVNEMLSEVYYPASEYTLNEARHEAAGHARETVGDWARTRYDGLQELALHDHDEWEECTTCPAEPTWAFAIYETA